MGGRSLVISQGRKVGFLKKFQGIIFLLVWDRVVGERGWVFFWFFILFCFVVVVW